MIGVVVLVVAGMLALAGRAQLRKAAPPGPEYAAQSVRDDVAAAREAVRR